MVEGGLKYSSSYYREPFHEKPAFQYLKLLLITATLVVGIMILIQSNGISGAVVTGTSTTIDVNDFLAKLTSHPETGAFVGVSPLNIIQINSNNMANLQSQISGLDISHLGSFIVQYTDAIIVYDYNNDVVRDTVSLQQPQQAALPGDFFTKLNTHSELVGLSNEQPIGGQLDAASLDTLKQQFPQVYANAKVGDYLLRYSTILVIYDYDADVMVNSVALG